MTEFWSVRRLRGVIPLALTALTATACAGGLGSAARQIHDDAGSKAASPSATASPSTTSPGQSDPALAPFYNQQVSWGRCPATASTSASDLTLFDCAKLRVPLDYTHPSGTVIQVEMIRQRSTGSAAERQGSLLINPGGPGGSGLDYLSWGASQIPTSVTDYYDLVSFDPRGVGLSAPVRCLSDSEQDSYNSVDAPQDPTQEHQFAVQRQKQFDDECEAKSGWLLPFVGTRNQARDMDVMRAVLGDRKLNYLGYSYGTYLGTLYADMFPSKTGHLVLDGAVDPTADSLDSMVDQSAGFEGSLRAFVADCVTHSDCPLGSTDPTTAINNLADFLDNKLRDNPLPTSDGRKLTSSLGWTGVDDTMYSDGDQSWQLLRQALSMAIDQGDGSGLLSFADEYNGRNAAGHYSNEMDANAAISCADGSGSAPSPQRVQQILDELHQRAPITSKDVTADDLEQGDCQGWPYQSPEKPHAMHADGSAPILVVGATQDPATPYAWAQNLSKQLSNATLLTRVGNGHTSSYGGKSKCIDGAVTAYLVHGTIPAAGTTCSS